MVTSKKTDELVKKWQEERRGLFELVKQLEKPSSQLQQEAGEKLDGLARTAKAKLRWWSNENLSNQLDEQARKTFDKHIKVLHTLIQKRDTETIADTYLPELYGRLDSNLRALDNLISHHKKAKAEEEKKYFMRAFRSALQDKNLPASEELLQLDCHTSVNAVEKKWDNDTAKAFAIARYEYEAYKVIRTRHTDTSHLFSRTL